MKQSNLNTQWNKTNSLLLKSNIFHVYFNLLEKFELKKTKFKMVSMHSEKPKCAPSCLWKVPPSLPLKWLQCSLIEDGPLLSFPGRLSSASPWRLSSASPFHASLNEAIDGVTSLAFCPQVVSEAPQHFRSSEIQANCDALSASLSAWSFPFTPACPGQYTYRSFRGWMLTLDPFVWAFTFCSELTESVWMMACVVWFTSSGCVTASTSSQARGWGHESCTDSWMVVAPCLTVKPHPDRTLVTIRLTQ